MKIAKKTTDVVILISKHVSVVPKVSAFSGSTVQCTTLKSAHTILLLPVVTFIHTQTYENILECAQL